MTTSNVLVSRDCRASPAVGGWMGRSLQSLPDVSVSRSPGDIAPPDFRQRGQYSDSLVRLISTLQFELLGWFAGWPLSCLFALPSIPSLVRQLSLVCLQPAKFLINSCTKSLFIFNYKTKVWRNILMLLSFYVLHCVCILRKKK